MERGGELGALVTSPPQDNPDMGVGGLSPPSPKAKPVRDSPTYCSAPVAAIPFGSAPTTCSPF